MERPHKPLAAQAFAAEGKGAPHPGRVRASLWLPEPLTAEGKGAPRPGRGRPSLWPPGPLTGGKRHTAPGRTRTSLWLPEPLRPGKTQHAGATESAMLWRTRRLEPHSAQGPFHMEQPGAWAVWTGKAQTPLYGANPVWPEHGECSPHTATSVCSAPCLQRPTLPVAGLS